MKQGFERPSRHAADGEHAGDPLWLPDRGLEGDVDAGRPSDDHRPVHGAFFVFGYIKSRARPRTPLKFQ